MLSKLRCFSSISHDEIGSDRGGISPSHILSSINWSDSVVERVDYGTLSAAFIAHANNKALFLKTHLDKEGRATLEKEARFLKGLYGNVFSLDFQYVYEPDSDRHWLIMPVFEKNQRPLDPQETIQLLGGLGLQCLQQTSPEIIDVNKDNIEALVNFGKRAHINLSNQDLLDRRVREITLGALSLLEREIAGIQPALCHGDLSPVNIMRHNGAPILIDWEDAFVGVVDYDYLFWLTFFDNRKLYRLNPLQHISIDKEMAKALLVMIVLLKCELGWLRNDWRGNSLSFNERILEITTLN